MPLITNKKNLPLPIVKALQKMSESYDAGNADFTATSLLKPARIMALEKQYGGVLEIDAMNLIRSAHGTAIHHMFELAGLELEKEGYIAETRYYMAVSGKVIGAKIDLFDRNTGTLYDYKTGSVASIKKGLKKEYAQQINIGAECLRQNGFEVKALKIAFLPPDWRPWEAKNTKNYPEVYSEVDVELVSSEEILQFIKDRIKVHKEAEKKIPRCTLEETWGGNRCSGGWCPVSSMCEQFAESNKAGVKLMPAKNKESK